MTAMSMLLQLVAPAIISLSVKRKLGWVKLDVFILNFVTSFLCSPVYHLWYVPRQLQSLVFWVHSKCLQSLSSTCGNAKTCAWHGKSDIQWFTAPRKAQRSRLFFGQSIFEHFPGLDTLKMYWNKISPLKWKNCDIASIVFFLIWKVVTLTQSSQLLTSLILGTGRWLPIVNFVLFLGIGIMSRQLQ